MPEELCCYSSPVSAVGIWHSFESSPKVHMMSRSWCSWLAQNSQMYASLPPNGFLDQTQRQPVSQKLVCIHSSVAKLELKQALAMDIQSEVFLLVNNSYEEEFPLFDLPSTSLKFPLSIISLLQIQTEAQYLKEGSPTLCCI